MFRRFCRVAALALIATALFAVSADRAAAQTTGIGTFYTQGQLSGTGQVPGIYRVVTYGSFASSIREPFVLAGDTAA